jgi:hypothetical protein
MLKQAVRIVTTALYMVKVPIRLTIMFGQISDPRDSSNTITVRENTDKTAPILLS